MLAGFARLDITPTRAGVAMVGYGDDGRRALGTHEPLSARALVLGVPEQPVAICSLDLCYVGDDVVRAARRLIAEELDIAADRVFVAATHTHSGPHDLDPACWPDGLETTIRDAVARARDRMRPARVGAGFGMVHGHSLNRRRLEDPVDPALMVLRVDDLDGRTLGLCYGFGCHPVVLGPDNRLLSGDWPGSCSRVLEARLGPGSVALFMQGACADVNPLTDGTRSRFAEGGTVTGTARASWYYGAQHAAEPERRIGNRDGGTPAETAHLGRIVAEETLRVHRGIAAGEVSGLWTRRLDVACEGVAPSRRTPDDRLDARVERPRGAADDPLEVMLVGIDGPDVLILGQPGEVFAGTGVDLRRELRGAGFRHPFVVGYANGWRGYLPPRQAFPDGGYEIAWARSLGVPEALQDEIRTRIVNSLSDGLDKLPG